MKTAAVLVMLLFGASTAANAAVIGALDVTSGFWGSSNSAGTFDGSFFIAGDDFATVGAPANNNFAGFVTLGHSRAANGDFPYPLTVDGTTYPRTSFTMDFTHDPITIWQPPVLDSPQTSAFTMTGELRTCAFPDPCPADIPTFTLIGQGTMRAEWRSGEPAPIPVPFFIVSYTFTVPEPSTLMLLLLAIAGVAITLIIASGRVLPSRPAEPGDDGNGLAVSGADM